jgi:hypothetical protein
MTRGQTIAQAYAMRRTGTTFSVFSNAWLTPEIGPARSAGGPFTAGVSFALFEGANKKIRPFPRFIPEFAKCFLVGCAPVRW